MKKVFFYAMFLALIASMAYGQSWSPTPLVIDSPNVVTYAFNGTNVDIPFTTTGKPAQIYLVINTKLPDAQKPVAITNGFKGWHFVNGIDTTVYVSSGRDFDQGTHTYPWDGHGNEKNMENVIDSGVVAPGTYSYGLLGYDNRSSREVANDFIAIGFYSWPQSCLFYPYDDKTGALLSQPWIMGGQWHSEATSFNTKRGIVFKFKLGDDPWDLSKIETTYCPGYQSGEVVPGKSVNYTTTTFDPKDYNTFYQPKVKAWEYVSTVVKWSYVARGEAIQDISWGDWNKVQFQQFGDSDCPAGVLTTDGQYLYQVVTGKNPVQYQTDSIAGMNFDDPSDMVFNQLLLNEFYAPNTPPDMGGVARTVGEFNRIPPGPTPGTFYLSGDASCIMELANVHAMIEGSSKPYKADGTGYIMWANSNGDFFGDKNSMVETANPAQLWACQTYEPRNYNTMRKNPGPADMNAFMVAQIDFAGLYSAAAYTQDGSGIAYLRYGDDSFSVGGDNAIKKGFGYTMDADSQFDGIYMLKAVNTDYVSQNVYWDQTNWVAWDSDAGIITSNPVAVEDAAPAAFTVAQNTPNPFNPTTAINFNLAKQGQVSVDVFNVAGQKVATLLNDTLRAGSHSVTWDASGAAAGVYFYTVKSGDYSKTMKMTLLK